MSRQDELERYEQAEGQDLIQLLAKSKSSAEELRAPSDFRLNVLRKIEQQRSRPGAWSWGNVAFIPTWVPAAMAALLLLSLGVNGWLGARYLGQPAPVGEPVASAVASLQGPAQAYVFQEGITADADLEALVAAQAMETEPMIAFGFAAKPTPARRSFLLGTLYAEALAYVRSGNTEAAQQQWQVMDQALADVAEPLLSYRREMQSFLQHEPPAMERFETFLPLFESFYEASGVHEKDRTLPLFQAGAWLTNMRLAAAAGDTEGLRRRSEVGYFHREMTRIGAAKGILDRLERLGTLMAQDTLSEREIKTVLKLMQKMQQLLG